MDFHWSTALQARASFRCIHPPPEPQSLPLQFFCNRSPEHNVNHFFFFKVQSSVNLGILSPLLSWFHLRRWRCIQSKVQQSKLVQCPPGKSRPQSLRRKPAKLTNPNISSNAQCLINKKPWLQQAVHQHRRTHHRPPFGRFILFFKFSQTHQTGDIVGKDLLAEDVPKLEGGAVGGVVLCAVSPAPNHPPGKTTWRKFSRGILPWPARIFVARLLFFWSVVWVTKTLVYSLKSLLENAYWRKL